VNGICDKLEAGMGTQVERTQTGSISNISVDKTTVKTQIFLVCVGLNVNS
jgi:hypothetical protein